MNQIDRHFATYNFKKLDHLIRKEFYFWDETLARWKSEGWNGDFSVFNYDSDENIYYSFDVIGRDFLGWCEAPLYPMFKEEIIDIKDGYEYWRLTTGEIRKYTIGGRTAIMPQFVSAPVQSRDDWFNVIKPRLDPDTPERWAKFDEKQLKEIGDKARKGEAIYTAMSIGGYMYLRSLAGPENILYLFYDDPELVHEMMGTWLKLQAKCLMKVQDYTPFFRFFFGEDIAFKGRPLISPQLVEEFLMPYYRELFQILKSRQKEFMHIEMDSDGDPDKLLPLYIKNGITVLSPCEVAAGCDVVELRKKYPELVLSGGIDKRVVAEGKEAIKRELDRIIPFMKGKGGYIPTCDHGVPPDVSFENYLFYREYITSIDTL